MSDLIDVKKLERILLNDLLVILQQERYQRCLLESPCPHREEQFYYSYPRSDSL